MKSCYSPVVTNSIQNRIKFQAPCIREKGLPNWPCLFLIICCSFVFLPCSVLLSSTSIFLSPLPESVLIPTPVTMLSLLPLGEIPLSNTQFSFDLFGSLCFKYVVQFYPLVSNCSTVFVFDNFTKTQTPLGRGNFTCFHQLNWACL